MNSIRKLSIVSILSAVVSLLPTAGAEELSYRVEIRNTTGAALSSVPITFAHPFRRGDVPAGQTLRATIAGGDTPIDLQVNKKASHQDGSLRHAVMSTVLPSLGANQALTIELAPTTTSLAGTEVNLQSLTGSGQTVEVDLKIGGDTYRATLSEGLENPVSQWLGGPLASEWITYVPFKRTADGAPHSDLKARFYARKYAGSNNVKVDVVVENLTTFVGVRQRFDYAADIRINGNVVYSKNDIPHFSNTRWKYTFWTQGEPSIHVKFDPATLMATKAIPNYRRDLIWDTKNLGDYSVYAGSSYIDHGDGHLIDRFGPMGRGGNSYNSMSTTGGRGEIGPLPGWAANWVLTQRPDTWLATARNSDLAGSWGIHFRDENTGLPVTIGEQFGGYPEWGLGVGSPKVHPVSSAEGARSPLSPDTAHQPQFSFVPYLVTGDFYHLEELEFWQAYNWAGLNPGYRGYEKGYVMTSGQVRARAWSLRTLAMTAAFTPDAHPLKAYYEGTLTHNANYFYERYLDPAASNYNNYGLVSRSTRQALWMNDYLSWAAGYVVGLGYEVLRPAADWLNLLTVARMGKGELNSQWCWQNAAAFSHGSSESWPRDLETINDVWAYVQPNAQGVACGTQAMADVLGLDGPGDMTGRPDSATSYVAQFGIALAAAVDLNVEGAEEAWNIYSGATGQRSKFPDSRGSPVFAIVPESYQPDIAAQPKPPSIAVQ